LGTLLLGTACAAPSQPGDGGVPAGAALSLLAGGGQRAEVGDTLPQRVVVRVTSVVGAGVGGARVTVAAALGGGTVTPMSVLADATGRAEFLWRLGPRVGRQVLQLQAGVGPTLEVEASAGPERRVVQLVERGPDAPEAGQTVPVVAEVRRVRDGAVVAGAEVAFASASGGGTVAPARVSTDAAGRAAAQWTLGACACEQDLTATALPTAAAGEAWTSVRVQALPEGRALLVVAGRDQTGPAGRVLADSIRIRLVRSRDGTAVTGAELAFTTIAGNGTVSSPARASDGTGYASIAWQLGVTSGPQRLRVHAMATASAAAAEVTVDAISTPFTAALGVGFGDEQFVMLPAPASFAMGSLNGWPDERPVRTVTLTSGIRIQRTEVTQAQWRQVMGTVPAWFRGCGETCPVEQVSWNDAQEFLARLNQADPGKGYRLPTEAEWEYAARAGTTGDYAGPLAEMAWTTATVDSEGPRPVGRLRPNGWSLFDMHGNLWEWVGDCYEADYYARAPGSDPVGPPCSDRRVARGGTWSNGPQDARSARRIALVPEYRNGSLGFRLVRER
jgi:formylglycine-generating enzyme required for sulfatase activity